MFSLFGCIAPLLGSFSTALDIDRQTDWHTCISQAFIAVVIYQSRWQNHNHKSENKILTLTLKLTRPIMTSLNSVLVYETELSSSKLTLISQLLT